MKKTMVRWLLVVLCLAWLAPAGAETRQAVIALEGTEETLQEKRLANPDGFSVWYAPDRLEAYNGSSGNMDGIIVCALYSDDHMILSMMTEEDAVEYAEESGTDIVKESADARVQTDVYRDLENGRYYFLTMIAEKGKYLRAVGDYSQEAAEGNGKLLQHVLESVSFGTEEPGDDPEEGFLDTEMEKMIPGQWSEEDEEDGFGAVLTLEDGGDLSLAFHATDGSAAYTYRGSWSIRLIPDYGSRITLLFTSTDHPSHAGGEYREECVYDAYTESWVEDDQLNIYLMLTPSDESEFVSPFADVLGYDEIALSRKQGPNMRVVNCKSFVSLREARDASSKRLEKVPLGALVLAFPEAGDENGFISCVYHDQYGYILAEYLQSIE